MKSFKVIKDLLLLSKWENNDLGENWGFPQRDTRIDSISSSISFRLRKYEINASSHGNGEFILDSINFFITFKILNSFEFYFKFKNI